MSSNPTPETIIREAIALSSCDPDGACPSVCGSVPPIDNCLRHQAISAVRQLVRERDRMGRLAEEQNNKLIAEMLRTEQAERDLVEARARLAGDRDLYEAAMNVLKQREREARAENERLRAENAWRASETEMLDRLEVLALDAAYSDAFVGLQLRAALAAAQETPAEHECRFTQYSHTSYSISGGGRRVILCDHPGCPAWTYGREEPPAYRDGGKGAFCACGHEYPCAQCRPEMGTAQEPPAEGGDR